VLAVNGRAPQNEGHRDMSQLIGAASSRATAQQGLPSVSVSRPDQTTEVPGWRRFAPEARGAAGGGGARARTQPTPQPTLRVTQHDQDEASLSSRSRQQRLSGEPRQSDEQRSNEQAQSASSTTDTTAGRVHIAQQREALLREFLRWRARFPSSNKKAPQATEDVFDEFMRSRGKR
jgi:hypothetical protein